MHKQRPFLHHISIYPLLINLLAFSTRKQGRHGEWLHGMMVMDWWRNNKHTHPYSYIPFWTPEKFCQMLISSIIRKFFSTLPSKNKSSNHDIEVFKPVLKDYLLFYYSNCRRTYFNWKFLSSLNFIDIFW